MSGLPETAAATPGRRPTWLVLSPHLDDAALSCGGTIHHLARRGERVVVYTAVTADEPQPAPGPFAAGMVRGWRFPPGRAMAGRRDEDRAACAALGAEPVYGPFAEAIQRCDPAGGPLYGSVAALFGPPAAGDPAAPALPAEVAAQVAALSAATRVLAPLGVGGHVDHRLLRDAADRLQGVEVLFYEEYPYSRQGGDAVAPALGDLARWRHALVPLAAADLEAKAGAIAAYRSQVPHLFRGGAAAVAREVGEQARAIGGERLWRRVAARELAGGSARATEATR